MAFSDRLQFILDLDASKAISETKKFGDTADRELGKADDRFNQIGGRMQVAGAGMLAFAGVAGTALMSFARSAEEAEAEERKLNLALANSPQLAGASKQAFLDLAEELQNTTTAEGDAVVGLEGLLGTLGRTQDEILELTPLVVDLATRYGMDFEAAGRLVNSAVEGNTGRLERLIGTIGETESVADALRRTVGGFAASEAESFSGQIEQMKNKLGDLAEGIGVGVVDAMGDMADIAGTVLDKLGALSGESLAGVGKWATYGTALLAVSGVISIVGGSILRLKGQLTGLIDTLGKTRSALDSVGGAKAVGIFGGVLAAGTALAVGLDSLEDSLISTRISVEELSRATDDELVESVDGLVAANTRWGQSQADVYAEMAQNDIGVLTRYRDALEAAGRDTTLLDEAIRNEALAQERATQTTETGTAAVEDLTGATGELDAATQRVNEQLEANHARNQEVIDSRNELLSSTLALFSSEIAYRESLLSTNEAIAAYNEVAASGTATTDELTQAQIDAEQAALKQADAATQLAIDQAEANGQVVDAAEQEAIYRQQLEAVAATLAPGSPLRAQLEGYIGQLNSVPSTVSTTFESYYAPPTGSVPAGQTPVIRRAKGGPVEKGQPYLVGDKNGITDSTELFIPGESGMVRPITTTNGGAPVAPTGWGAGGDPDWDAIGTKLAAAIAKSLPMKLLQRERAG